MDVYHVYLITEYIHYWSRYVDTLPSDDTVEHVDKCGYYFAVDWEE